jgi:hypothetical protein
MESQKVKFSGLEVSVNDFGNIVIEDFCTYRIFTLYPNEAAELHKVLGNILEQLAAKQS